MREIVLITRKSFPCSNCPKDNKVESLNDEFNTNHCPVCMEVINYEQPQEVESVGETTDKGVPKKTKPKRKNKQTNQLNLDL